MKPMRTASLATVALLILAPSISQAAPKDEAACAKLKDLALPASAMGLPSGGATITGATFVAATPEKSEPGPGGRPRITLARPDRCEVRGEIAPVDPTAPKIQFQINLPNTWNGKSMQMGGGGFDGNLQTGLGGVPRAPDLLAYPITRGFVTYGSDGGHQGEGGKFALNAEALANFINGQTKKVHDVAMAVVKARYGKAPRFNYFIGQSEGGREALVSAQQYPQDYDGIVATAPALHYIDAMFRLNNVGTAVSRPGGGLNAAKLKLFGKAVLDQCDMNDGVADGIVGNYLGCQFDPAVLRCPMGLDAGDTCLSDAQINTINVAYRATVVRDGKGAVIARYPRYLLGGGEDLPGSLPAWAIGRAPMPRIQPPGDKMDPQKLGIATAAYYGNSMIRYFLAKDETLNTYDFDATPYADQIRAIVPRLANDNPDLSAFKARGGKMILLHNTSDAALSSVSTMNYFDAVSAKLGKDAAASFARLYIVPGGDHGGGNTASKVDLVGMLDAWVSNGKAPGDDLVAEEDDAGGKAIRTKPLCAYPYYPRYAGAGDAKAAASYTCAVARP